MLKSDYFLSSKNIKMIKKVVQCQSNLIGKKKHDFLNDFSFVDDKTGVSEFCFVN